MNGIGLEVHLELGFTEYVCSRNTDFSQLLVRPARAMQQSRAREKIMYNFNNEIIHKKNN